MDEVRNYLKKYLTGCPEEEIEFKMSRLSLYKDLLLAENLNINLISRKMNEEDVWLKNILDSILMLEKFKLSNEKLLDFGTGGGLPGIPLKIIFPGIYLYLLDSRAKKINVLKKIIKKLDLKSCFTISIRMEEMNLSDWGNYFDIIVSRSVRITDIYRDKMMRILRSQGRIWLYKGKKMEDIDIFSSIKDRTAVSVYDVSKPFIGTRKIIEIRKI